MHQRLELPLDSPQRRLVAPAWLLRLQRALGSPRREQPADRRAADSECLGDVRVPQPLLAQPHNRPTCSLVQWHAPGRSRPRILRNRVQGYVGALAVKDCDYERYPPSIRTWERTWVAVSK